MQPKCLLLMSLRLMKTLLWKQPRRKGMTLSVSEKQNPFSLQVTPVVASAVNLVLAETVQSKAFPLTGWCMQQVVRKVYLV